MAKRQDQDLAGAILIFILFFIFSIWHVWKNYRTQFYFFLALLILLMAAVVYIFYKIKKRRYSDIYDWHAGKDLLNRLRRMHPSEFEDYVSDLYDRLGYKTERVGRSHDGGVDVIATKDGIKHYIQCKKYITRQAGVGDVRDFAGALMDKLSAGKGIFITTNIFTTEAEQYAIDKPIELIDGDRLLRLIKQVGKDTDEVEIKNDRICPLCGGKLVERAGKYGKFWGCNNYPKCQHTEN
jgi:HJR/Mrr/RecB family endonuclease